MNSEQYETLRNQLCAIEAELRETRKALELHAPELQYTSVEKMAPKLSAEDLDFDGADINGFLESDAFNALPEAIDRFLGILGFLHHLNGDSFSKVSEVRGRKRIYFSKSIHEIEMSGRATEPRQIPKSDWFVVSNNSTKNKAALLVRVCQILKHSAASCVAVSLAMDPDAGISLRPSENPEAGGPEEETGLQI